MSLFLQWLLGNTEQTDGHNKHFTCRLQRFVGRVQTAVNSHPRHSTGAQLSVSTTLAAFAAALADQMRPMWAELVHLEEYLHPRDSGLDPGDSGFHPKGSGTHTQPQPPKMLLGLEYQLQVWQQSYYACV